MKKSLILAMLLVGGCSMEPKYIQPELPVPASWPVGDAYLVQSEAELPALSYRQLFGDPRLQSIIEQALSNNRDLRIAAANIAAARAQVRIRRGNQLPGVDASVGADYGTRQSGGEGASYSTNIGITGFEIDLFGRLASLTHADQDRLLATEAAARATKLALVSDIADTWLQLAADRSLLLIAQDSVTNAEKSVYLTRARLEGGISSRIDLRQAEQISEGAKADVASLTTAVAQDQNRLQLLVGAPVDSAALPTAISDAAPQIAALPAGLDSRILLRRPDVVQSEYLLRAANAEIGAARAALFPQISLTSIAGLASSALSSLFTGGAFNWSVGGDARYSIFSGGAGRASVDQAKAQRDAALAEYEKAIQTAFREVSDALARQGTIDAEKTATLRQEQAAADSYRLADARYRGGIDPFLSSLDAQRSYYNAQRQSVAIILTEAQSRVNLYRTLGGDPSLN